MNDRKRPLKPARNPSHLVFPKKGPVRQVVENFPQVQEDLETTVGKNAYTDTHFSKPHKLLISHMVGVNFVGFVFITLHGCPVNRS